MKRKFTAAMINETCPVCGETSDVEVVHNEVHDEGSAGRIDLLDGSFRYGKICSDCRKQYPEDQYILISFDNALTDDIGNPFLSGNLWTIGFEEAKNLFGYLNKDGYSFISDSFAEKAGLFPDNSQEEFNIN